MDVVVIIFLILIISVVVFFYSYSPQKQSQHHLSSKKHHSLQRHHKNPLLSPKPYKDWQAGGTFNPATFKDEDGRVHVIYRAVGGDGVSRLGYASSEDGVHFDDHEHYPVFSIGYTPETTTPKRYDRILYPSGGSFGGCEDPRMVIINERIYVTFSAFGNWGSIRVGVISIHKEDFLNKRWNWSEPLLISPPKAVHKNWVLFPEKINERFAILHSISPRVQIDFVERLEDLAYGVHVVSSEFSQSKEKREDVWEDFVRGAGPPPIKTDKGWLLLYHAIDKYESHKYKLGALLLDLDDPKKVIARARKPILEPDMWYENDWKPGVIYACGAVVKNDTLHVYYGGGDKHICVAQTSLSSLLTSMTDK